MVLIWDCKKKPTLGDQNWLPMTLRSLVLFFLLLIFVPSASAAVAVVNPIVENQTTETLEDLLLLDNQAIGEKLGRKLNFKERIAVSIIRGKLKRAKKREARRAAKGKAPPMGRDWTPVAALVCLILALFIPFLLIPALIFSIIGKKRNRYIDPGRYKLANVCFIISLVLLILFVLLLLFLIALFAAF